MPTLSQRLRPFLLQMRSLFCTEPLMVMLHSVKGSYGYAESLADVHPVSGNFMQKEVVGLY
jgi:hypothetical protein